MNTFESIQEAVVNLLGAGKPPNERSEEEMRTLVRGFGDIARDITDPRHKAQLKEIADLAVAPDYSAFNTTAAWKLTNCTLNRPDEESKEEEFNMEQSDRGKTTKRNVAKYQKGSYGIGYWFMRLHGRGFSIRISTDLGRCLSFVSFDTKNPQNERANPLSYDTAYKEVKLYMYGPFLHGIAVDLHLFHINQRLYFVSISRKQDALKWITFFKKATIW